MEESPVNLNSPLYLENTKVNLENTKIPGNGITL
jgi:hypothetical protein